MSMDITLISIPHNAKVTVNRFQLLELFPNSLPSLVLDLDPTTENIEIPNPIITPDVLDAIKYMVENKNTPMVTPKENWEQAGKYLLIDVISAMADPDYLSVRQKTRINLFDKNDLKKRYSHLINFFIIYDAPKIIEYILNHTPFNRKDSELYQNALREYKIEIVKLFIQKRGIVPTHWNLYYVATHNNMDLVKLILSSRKWDGDILLEAHKRAIEYSHIDIAKLLIPTYREYY